LAELKDKNAPHPWLGKTRAAALGFGLGATLALSPLVWAENSPATSAQPQTGVTPPETMTSPIALIQHQSFAPLVKKVSPAVVNISVTQKVAADAMADEPEAGSVPGFPNSPFDEMLRRFFDQQNPNGQRRLLPQTPGGQAHRIALGSGFIVDPSGTVVTNSHVVGNAGKVEVTLQDDSKYTAKIIGRDPKTDIAVLKINADKPLPYVSFGDSSAAQVGDWVMAVGNPFGLGGTVTTGISCRSTRRSIAAILAGRPSISMVRWSALTPLFIRPMEAAWVSVLPCPRTSPRLSWHNWNSTAR
jgi:serine protease Do